MISVAGDPGRIGRTAYTYAHRPLVAGIIVAAAADERVIAHPSEPSMIATTAVILGGPALYLAGIVWFRWALTGLVRWSQLSAIVVMLVALVPLSALMSTLTLYVAATLVLVAVAAWDVYAELRINQA